MSSAPQESPTESPGTSQTDNEAWPGQGWIKRNWARIRLGHEGMALDSVQRGLRIREALARNVMTGNMADTTGWPAGDGEGDDMGVDIGDKNRTVHNHYYPTEPVAAEASVNDSSPEPSSGVTAKQAVVGAIATALLGGALGGGIPWALGAFSSPDVPAAAADHVDTNTQNEYQLYLGTPHD